MDKDKFIKAIKAEFPNLEWKNFKYNGEGMNHHVFILDDKYIFRFPRTKEYLNKLENEIELLQYLRNKVNVPIPEYCFVPKKFCFVGYLKIKGDEFDREIFDSLNTDSRMVVAKQIADFLSVIHTIPKEIAEKYAKKSVKNKNQYKKFFSDVRRILIKKIPKKKQILVYSFLKELKDCPESPNMTFIHEDLYFSHILFDGDKKEISGIIDFSDREIGDPAIDFSELWLYGEKFVKDVYELYKGPRDGYFLNRSLLYYKKISLSEMIKGLKGEKGSFGVGYKIFKEVFK